MRQQVGAFQGVYEAEIDLIGQQQVVDAAFQVEQIRVGQFRAEEGEVDIRAVLGERAVARKACSGLNAKPAKPAKAYAAA